MKSITSQIKLHVYCKQSLGLDIQGSFSCMFKLDNISILLDEDNDLKREITDLFKGYLAAKLFFVMK